MLEMGGVPAMEKINKEKQKFLSILSTGPTFSRALRPKEDRSIMNVPFTASHSTSLPKKCLKEASRTGLVQLKATEASAGAARPSIYNAMPMEASKSCRFPEEVEGSNNVKEDLNHGDTESTEEIPKQ